MLSASDFITTQPSFVMGEVWQHHDLQVLEPVAAPKDFPMRFAWSARNTSHPGNTWLRRMVIAAYASYEAGQHPKDAGRSHPSARLSACPASSPAPGAGHALEDQGITG